ncbi:hypothetical protein GCM10011511_26270 [Puia dinghuensis]|uniref:Helix-turn-helix domain-containing protein n=2 Tax=Puia dinghuensis TaxID=1792502 RepID=A0A8J2UDN8_9BACT|nr:hypothetical protein GCM10011511_26270 [Puia dinghuensis]
MPPEVLRAYHYHLKGLTARETAKLLDVSTRTVQRWASEYRFKEKARPDTLQQRAAQLRKQGFSYQEIAATIRKSRTTVYNYLKAAKR